jgi:Cu+-exporting ATPase
MVFPGEQIPVDGVVTETHASFNEAMLTEETLPKERSQAPKS